MRNLDTAIDPLRAFCDLARTDRDLRVEWVPESPGWSQVFIHRAPGTGDQDDTIVVTHDGADFCATFWDVESDFYERDEPTTSDRTRLLAGTDDPVAALSLVREMLR